MQDYALLRHQNTYNGVAWSEWPAALRDRDPEALKAFSDQQQLLINYFLLKTVYSFAQWQTGAPMPITKHSHSRRYSDFVAWDSADVWANRDMFYRRQRANPASSSSVPPVIFLQEGQRWEIRSTTGKP